MQRTGQPWVATLIQKIWDISWDQWQHRNGILHRGDKLADFCYNTGYQHFTQIRRDYTKAIQYLNYGLQVRPNNSNLLNGIAQTYQLMGDTQKANSYLMRLQQ